LFYPRRKKITKANLHNTSAQEQIKIHSHLHGYCTIRALKNIPTILE